MESLKLHYVDLGIILLYLLSCLYLGLRKKTQANNFKEFAVSTGALPTFALVSMFFATHIGAGTTVGAVERIYSLGLFYGIAYLINPLFWLITAMIFAKNIEKFDGCLSLPDVMNKLYGAVGRWTTVALSIGTCIGVIAVQLSAIGYLTQHFLGFSTGIGIAIGCAIVCLNVFFGGAKAVVITDIFQFCIFYIAIPSLCAMALSEVNGFEGLVQKVPAELLTINLTSENIWLFISFIFYALLPLADSTFIQRFLMARNSERLKRALYNTALIGLPFALVIFLIGLLSKALAPDINPNEAFYFLLSRYAPIGFLGLLISGMLAVVMSTANSWLNSASVICANDIAPLFAPKITKSTQLLVARVSTIGITILAILLANAHENLISLVWLADNFWYPVMFLPIVFGFKGLASNSKTFTISMVTAILCTLIARYIQGDFDTLTMCIGMTGSATSFLIAHYWQFGGLNKTVNSLLRYIKFNTSYELKAEETKLLKPELKTNIFIFCTFMIFQYIPSIFEAAVSGSIDYAPIFLTRTLSVVFAIILFSHEYWSSRLREKYLLKFWYLNIFISLSFSPFYMYMSSPNKIIWVINGVLCIFILSMFFKVSRALFLLLLGVSTSLLSHEFLGAKVVGHTIANESTIVAISIIYGLMGAILILVSRNIFDTKVSAMSLSTSYIAHEVRGSLASSSMYFSFFDSILSNANIANKGRNTIVEFKTSDWDAITDLHKKARVQSDYGVGIVKSILNMHSSSYTDFGVYKISSILEEAMQYPESNRIELQITKDFQFYGSFKAIKMVFENIISNFVKYAGVVATLKISVNGNTITLRDNGTGIPERIIDKIFNSKTTTEGYGLGLALCKSVILEHGGDIQCSSEQGEFTQFIIRLPKIA